MCLEMLSWGCLYGRRGQGRGVLKSFWKILGVCVQSKRLGT